MESVRNSDDGTRTDQRDKTFKSTVPRPLPFSLPDTSRGIGKRLCSSLFVVE